LVLCGLKELDVQPPKNVKFDDDPLADLLVDTLPECEEPKEKPHWISHKRMGRFSPNARKPRPVLIGFSSVEQKHKFLKLSKQLRQNGLRLDDWLKEVQQKERCTLDADFQTLKGKATSPFSEAQYLCTAATTRHVFARKTKQTLFHLLHRTTIVILIAFTTFLVFDYLNSAFCKQ